MTGRPSIVVLTPLKNDAWIMRRFLEVTSLFADRIIVADQGSTDGGQAICREFPKVTLIENPSTEYDEASRQKLLIEVARETVPMPRILLALDSDEILTGDSIDSPGWRRMLEAAPGTTLFFEKPQLFLTADRCERRPLDFAGGFVDDGVSMHRPLRVHSVRLPVGPPDQRLVIDDVRFMHYALARPGGQIAKIRMYAMMENLMGTKTPYQRRRYYWSRRVLRPFGPVEPTPPGWFARWEAAGIDMRTIEDAQPYWQDVASLDMLLRHGSRRFWFDDVWKKDWEALRRDLGRTGRVTPPPWPLLALLDAGQWMIELVALVRRWWHIRRHGHF